MQDIQKTTSPDKESYLKELCTPDYLMHIHKLIKILILQTCKKHNTHRNSFYLLTPETEHGTRTKDGSISAVNSHVCNISVYQPADKHLFPREAANETVLWGRYPITASDIYILITSHALKSLRFDEAILERLCLFNQLALSTSVTCC